MSRPMTVITLAVLTLLTACVPLSLPATETPFVMCTPPPCAANESYSCPGDCPGGCGTLCATHTPGPTLPAPADASPTPYPLACTPPPCWSDEVYYCAGECPGGCGTACATRTPDPSALPTPTFPAALGLCETPPADSSPALTVCLSRASIRVGEYAAIFAEATGVTSPLFILQAQDDGGGWMRVEVMPENRVRARDVFSTIAALDDVQVHETRAFFYFRGLAPGTLTVTLSTFGPDFTPLDAAPLTLTVLP